MKKRKSNLDEMQEQKLLKIEHNGCWLAFWGLLLVMGVQMFMYGAEGFKTMAGEWTVFMALCIYMLVACLRNGIWDRHLEVSPKVNLLCSAAAGIIMGVAYFFISLHNYGDMRTAILTAVMLFIATFVLCLAALMISTGIYKKQVSKMESETPESENADDAK